MAGPVLPKKVVKIVKNDRKLKISKIKNSTFVRCIE